MKFVSGIWTVFAQSASRNVESKECSGPEAGAIRAMTSYSNLSALCSTSEDAMLTAISQMGGHNSRHIAELNGGDEKAVCC
jgi:hypothetical protein